MRVSEGTKVAGFAGEVPSLTGIIAGEGSIRMSTVQAPETHIMTGINNIILLNHHLFINKIDFLSWQECKRQSIIVFFAKL